MTNTVKDKRDTFMEVKELAGLLNCSPRHAYRLIGRNQVPGVVRLGRLIRLNRQVVAAWIGQSCPPAGRPNDQQEVSGVEADSPVLSEDLAAAILAGAGVVNETDPLE